jgi:hypothetical protein
LRRKRFSAASTERRAVRDRRKRIQSVKLLIRIGKGVARNWRKRAIWHMNVQDYAIPLASNS